MATYTELHELRSEPSLKMRIMVAIADVAADVLAEPVPATPTERRDWAKIAIIRPDNESRELIWAFLISNQSAIAAYNSQLVRNLEMSYLNTLMSLNLILEAKHPYTQGHSRRVVNLCMMIGRKMGLNSTEMEALKDGAMLHDLGKIGVSDLILNKKSDLTEEEVNIIRRHPIIGEEIIKPITFLAPARSIIRHHHEWINGMGWPDGLAGDEISLKVAVCSVADAIDAMSSDRIYRRPLTLDKIKHELTRNAGTQFHPDVINAALDFITPDILEQIDNTTS